MMRASQLLGVLFVFAFIAISLLGRPPGALAAGPAWSIASFSEPTNLPPPVNEVQDVTVRATGGSFTLAFEAAETNAIAFNAPAATVQAELDALSSIGGVGASVIVTGGPGDERGSNPYVITFSGSLSARRVAEISANSASLTGSTASATVTVATEGGTHARYVVIATNTGGSATDGGTITIGDALPAGVTVNEELGVSGAEEIARNGLTCQALPSVSCTYAAPVPPGDSLVVKIPIELPPNASVSTVTNMATVAGGGLAEATTSSTSTISAADAPFGLPADSFTLAPSSAQAGAHADLTTSLAFNSVPNLALGSIISPFVPAGSPKDIEVALPAGFIGNPTAIPQCPTAQLEQQRSCPVDSQVGVVYLNFGGSEFLPAEFPVYNMVPSVGEPAKFGLFAITVPAYISVHVRSDGDYGVTADVTNVTEAFPLTNSILTLWGVPGDRSHDPERWNGATESFGASSSAPPEAFLSNPTSCQPGPLAAGLSTDSWQAPGTFLAASTSAGEMAGCDQLAFRPSINVGPDTPQAGEPAGYTAELKLPQSNDPASFATPTLRSAKVTLPAGTVVSPASADGLQGCSDNPSSTVGDQFGLHSLAPASCPQASQIGTLEVHSPLLSQPLEGQVFLGQPNCAPCSTADAQNGNMIRLFLQAQGSGVIVKLRGSSSLDPSTGQITTTFSENPQLPFGDLKLILKGGPRAPLANPRVCGPAEITTDLTPWSSPFTPDATPHSFFEVSGCGAPQFGPSFTAGTSSNHAGGFSPFALTLSRADQDQDLGQVSVHMPPGLLGMLSKVALCGEVQAQQGTCPGASQIGHVTVAAGAGSNPLYIPQAGRPQAPVFLTGPYKGAPFGLSIAVPAQAGPFDLGTVVVRSAIHIDAHTAQATIISDPLPQMQQGIPLHIRTVNVAVDREGFIFNPTSCAPLTVAGTVTSILGASANVATRFQAADCASLPFKPKFTVSTQGHTSKKGGASLDVKVGSGPGQANIAKALVSLPKQLPSRLTTLQQACPEATFAANPATCPVGSNVGTAKAVTPVLNAPLTGPAYLVSHGGAAFPDLVVILQGQGVLLDLVGNTNIKKGITTSSFNSVPDAPVTSFELTLPEGSHSALTTNLPAKANHSLCGTKLVMPTTLTGQNGAQVKQSTKIAVTGCPKRHVHKVRRAKGRRRGSRVRAPGR